MGKEKNRGKFVEILSGQVSLNSISANIALLLLRIFTGYTIMIAELDKLPNKKWMIEQVTSLGFPFPSFFA